MAPMHQSGGVISHYRSMSPSSSATPGAGHVVPGADHVAPGAGHVAIVGAGVRGTQVLLQLARQWRSRPPSGRVQVHVIDPWPPGPGRTWRVDQSDLLVMNGPISGTTAYLPGEGPSLFEWAQQVAPGLPGLPEWARREARNAQADTYCSRPLYGHYLRWVYEQASSELPPSVDLVYHRLTVTAAEPAGSAEPAGAAGTVERAGSAGKAGAEPAWTSEPAGLAATGRTELRLSDGSHLLVDAVVLTLGWLPSRDAGPSRRRIRPGHPTEQDFDRVEPGQRLLVHGMGMSFFDAFSLLTAGRGGHFVPAGTGQASGRATGSASTSGHASGALRYIPSGREPHLIVGSRRGVPYRSKPPAGMPASFPHANVEALRDIRHRRWDFAAEILPAIRRDATLAYYSVLLQHYPHRIRSGPALLKQLQIAPEVDWPDIVAEAVPHPGDRLDLARVENPGLGRSFATAGEAEEWVAADIAADLHEASLAERSPLKAAMRSIGDARRVVVPLVEFSGISGASLAVYRRFTSWGAMMSGGPPAWRNQQLLAAWRAGVVTFTGPGLQVQADADGFVGTTSAVPGVVHHGEVLLDAWLHAPSVEASADPLLNSLAGSGLGRAHRVDGVASGALEVEPAASRVITADGAPAPGVFALGIPCEGQRVFTILSPHAGTESQVIAECAATAGAVVDLIG